MKNSALCMQASEADVRFADFSKKFHRGRGTMTLLAGREAAATRMKTKAGGVNAKDKDDGGR